MNRARLRQTAQRRKQKAREEEEEEEERIERVEREVARKRFRSSEARLHQLPSEILLLVLSFLDCKTLCRVAQVSHRLRELAEKNQLWMNLYSQHFHEWSGKNSADHVWKLLYKSKYNWKKGNYYARCVIKNDGQVTALHSCGEYVACGLSDGVVELLTRNSHTYSAVRLSLHTSQIRCIHVSKFSLVTTCSDGRLVSWNMHESKLQHQLRHSGPEISYMDVLFSDSKTLITCQSGLIMLWNLKDGTCTRAINGSDDPILYFIPAIVDHNSIVIHFAQHIISPFTTSSLILNSISLDGVKVDCEQLEERNPYPSRSLLRAAENRVPSGEEQHNDKRISANVFAESSNEYHQHNFHQTQ